MGKEASSFAADGHLMDWKAVPSIGMQICLQRPPPPAFKKLDSSQHVSKAVALSRGWPTSHEPPPELTSHEQPVAASSAPPAPRVKFGTRYNSFESIDENTGCNRG